MLVQKYITEYYYNSIGNKEPYKYEELFVKEYKMVIGLNPCEVIYVHNSDEPRNKYKDDYNVYEHKISEINVSDEFINKCYEMLKIQNKIFEEMRPSYQVYLDSKSTEEKTEAEYQHNLFLFCDHYNKNEFEKAITLFQQNLENFVSDNNKKSDMIKVLDKVSHVCLRLGKDVLAKKYLKLKQDLVFGPR
jgi:hypothetical protein